MSLPPTNYLVLNPTTKLYQDLSDIFLARTITDPSANPTGFKYLDANGNQTDINTRFYPWSTGLTQLSYTTHMYSLTGTELSKVFVAKNTNINDYINVEGLYTYNYDGNYFIVVFADYSTPDPMSNPSAIGYNTVSPNITFKLNIPNVQFTLVGGGGGGGANDDSTQDNGGGGGQGGGNTTYVTTSIIGTYNLQVGGGGAGGAVGGGVIGTSTTVTQSSVQLAIALGGSPGRGSTSSQGGAGGSGSGNGGNGGNGGVWAGGTKAQNGTNGSFVPIYTNGTSYYYGGGGAGGQGYATSVGASGGLGGGGGSGNGSGNNQGQPYKGPNNISYATGVYGITGIPSSGGGGSGGNGQGKTKIPGNVGGSGIVIVTFQAL